MVNSFRKIKARELLLDLPLDVADDIPEPFLGALGLLL